MRKCGYNIVWSTPDSWLRHKVWNRTAHDGAFLCCLLALQPGLPSAPLGCCCSTTARCHPSCGSGSSSAGGKSKLQQCPQRLGQRLLLLRALRWASRQQQLAWQLMAGRRPPRYPLRVLCCDRCGSSSRLGRSQQLLPRQNS